MYRPALALVCLILFAGCERTRSFLNMSSDSPMPFMGLELAVDAKDPVKDRDSVYPVAMRASDELLPEQGNTGEVVSLDEFEDERITDQSEASGIDRFWETDPSSEVEDIVVRISGN